MEEQKEFILTDERAFYLIKLHFQQMGHASKAINHALSSIGSKFYASCHLRIFLV